jgi:hypothetical protein
MDLLERFLARSLDLPAFLSLDATSSAERLAVAPAKWKLEFKKDVIAGCH